MTRTRTVRERRREDKKGGRESGKGREGVGGWERERESGSYVNNTKEPWIPLHLYGVTLRGRTVNLGLPWLKGNLRNIK